METDVLSQCFITPKPSVIVCLRVIDMIIDADFWYAVIFFDKERK